MADIKVYLKQQKEIIDEAIDKYLPAISEPPTLLHEAMRYSMLSNGKRIRPILFLETSRALGLKDTQVLPAAVAIECIHCFSLIHDDLPIIDDDDYRRGILTCHKKYGDAIALLAGDSLLAQAFYILAAEQSKLLDSNIVVALQRELALAASSVKLIGGQVYDILAERGEIEHSIEILSYIHENKTGALLVAAIKMAALAADSDNFYITRLTNAAKKLGLAFQIKDDVLDIIGDEKLLGKTVGRDQTLGKLTYPLFFDIPTAENKCKELLAETLQLIEFLGPQGSILRELFSFIVNREY